MIENVAKMSRVERFTTISVKIYKIWDRCKAWMQSYLTLIYYRGLLCDAYINKYVSRNTLETHSRLLKFGVAWKYQLTNKNADMG